MIIHVDDSGVISVQREQVVSVILLWQDGIWRCAGEWLKLGPDRELNPNPEKRLKLHARMADLPGEILQMTWREAEEECCARNDKRKADLEGVMQW